MKTIYIITGLLVITHTATAQRQGQNQVGPTIGYELRDSINNNFQWRAWAQNQWRIVNGQTNNLAEPGWRLVKGVVMQSEKNGLHVNVGGGARILVANAGPAADDTAFSDYVKPAGLYTYITTLGSQATIHKYDRGIDVPAPKTVIARESPPRPLTMEEQADQSARVLKFQKDQAEKGFPSFQFIMGQRYLTGDGVKKDVFKARSLFELAAKQGNAQASNALAELNKSPVAAK